MGSTPHLAAATSALAGPVLAKPLPQKRLRGKAQIASMLEGKQRPVCMIRLDAHENGRRSQGCRCKKILDQYTTAQSPMCAACNANAANASADTTGCVRR